MYINIHHAIDTRKYLKILRIVEKIGIPEKIDILKIFDVLENYKIIKDKI